MRKASKGKLSNHWKPAIEAVLDVYLGENKTNFKFEGKEYTPKSFAEYVKINPSNYVTITSFKHAKMYEEFVLNIPDIAFSKQMLFSS